MPTQDHDVPLTVAATERTHPAYAKLARACITLVRLARDYQKPPRQEVDETPTGEEQ